MSREFLFAPSGTIRGSSNRTTDGADGHGFGVKNPSACFACILALAALCLKAADKPQAPDAKALAKRAAAEFKVADRNGDGALTLAEFLSRGSAVNRADRKRRFPVFDFDGDGKLDGKEYHNFISPVDERGDVPDPIVEVEQAALAKWEALFTAADRDGDDALSQKEWPAERIAAEIPALAEVPFERWDRGGDGTIDRADGRWLFEVAYGLTQLDGRPLRTGTGRVFSWYYFRALDKNGDGNLSRQEFVSGHHEGPEKSSTIFADLDGNRDGQLTAEETLSLLWHDTISWFLGFDRNRDGFVSQDEFLLADFGKSLAARSVAAFDADGDGQISFREFRATTFANQASNWLQPRHDVDYDGRLSFKEFYLEKPPLLIAHSRFMFDHFDVDRDGFLSLSEFDFEAEFVTSDTDRDGQLTLAEFLATCPAAERADRARRFLVFDFDGNGKLDGKEHLAFASPVDERGAVPDPIVEIEQAGLAKWAALFTAADRDDDDALSQKEWPAERIAAEIPALAEVPFERWDRGGDGKVDRADGHWLFEVAYGLTQLDGRPLRTGTGRVFSWYYFRTIDKNGDGNLSRQEFVSGHHSGGENAEVFAALDTNGDGQLTDLETWSLLWHDTIAQFLEYDRDLDGYLSVAEMRSIGWGRTIARQCVPAFDGDRDGRLSFREFRQTTFANQASAWPLRQDTDHDGRLSWQEFCMEQPPLLIAQSRFLFDHFDRNQDGFLSALEFTIEGDGNQARILAYVEPFERCLPLEVKLARHVCELTDEQAAALERAGRRAIERRAEEMAATMRTGKVRALHGGFARAAPVSTAPTMARSPKLVMRRELVQALQVRAAELGVCPLDLAAFPDAWKKLDGECAAVAKRQRRAMAWAHVALLDEALLLSERQRENLIGLLAEETSDAWWRPTNVGVSLNIAAELLPATLAGRPPGVFAVPDVHLAKTLAPAQLAAFKELQQPRRQEVMIVQQAIRAAAAPAAPAIKAAVPGMLGGQPAQEPVVRRVVGRRPAVEDQQRRLTHYVELRLDDIDTACGLSHTQREKLALASKLDISRWRDQSPSPAGEKLAAGEKLVIQQVLVRSSATPLPPIFADLNSHFQKSLHGRLLDEQKRKLAAADRGRREFRRQSLLESIVAGFALAAALTADQCDLLAAALKAELPDEGPVVADWRLDCLHRVSQIPDERFRAIVYDFQREYIQRQRASINVAAQEYEMRQQSQAPLAPGAGGGAF